MPVAFCATSQIVFFVLESVFLFLFVISFSFVCLITHRIFIFLVYEETIDYFRK